ncbi:hypothetical protein HEK616_83140 (plasmid) [Streptomyces nigrescens]|uniref:Transposase n=1 Tax=Streptomyces nigrescens TaxID=1920 RepID=A0ABM8A8A5_STRNI|nr:hypothetical protein HEK616_83140 [Streptomyces nigrescens]
MPAERGAWQTVYHRFLQCRDAGVSEQLMDGSRRHDGGRDLSPVVVDSTVARAHHHAARMVVREEVLTALETANRKKRGHRGGRPVSHDTELDRDRNTVERCINKIKAWRGLTSRYDKIPGRTPLTWHSHLASKPPTRNMFRTRNVP